MCIVDDSRFYSLLRAIYAYVTSLQILLCSCLDSAVAPAVQERHSTVSMLLCASTNSRFASQLHMLQALPPLPESPPLQ